MQNGSSTDWINIATFISEVSLTAIAIIISIIALFQTKKQTQLSNKHQLFERRLDKYILIKELIHTYEILSGIFNERVNLEVNDRFILRSLMEIESLRDAMWIVDNPTEEKASKLIEEKLRGLCKLSEELRFIFDEKDVQPIAEFIGLYKTLLLWLQRYNLQKALTEGTDFGTDFKEKARLKIIDISKEMNQCHTKIKENRTLDKLSKQILLK